MGTGHHTEVGTPGDEDVVDVVNGRHGTHGHRGDPHFVSNPVTKRGLVEPSVLGTRLDRCLTGRYIDQVTPMALQGLGEDNSVVTVKPSFDPVGCRDANGDGFSVRPDLTHSVEHFQWVPHSVLHRAPVLI